MIAAVVLAAGTSTRYGEHKLLLPLQGVPIVRWAVRAVLDSRVEDVIVVLGRDADRVRETLRDLPVRFASNTRFREGMSTSVRTGLDALRPDTEAVLFALGDQPLLRPAVLDRLIEVFRTIYLPIVVPSYRGERGNPVLFGVAVLNELRGVRGDQGARTVIARDPARVAAIAFPFAAPRDVDTPADYAAVCRQAQLEQAQPNPDSTAAG